MHFRHTLFCFLHDSDSQIERVQVSPIGVIHIMIKQDIVLVSSLVFVCSKNCILLLDSIYKFVQNHNQKHFTVHFDGTLSSG